jgi:hypothetical protein
MAIDDQMQPDRLKRRGHPPRGSSSSGQPEYHGRDIPDEAGVVDVLAEEGLREYRAGYSVSLSAPDAEPARLP